MLRSTLTLAVLLFAATAALAACAAPPDTTAAVLQRMLERYNANRGGVGGFVVTAAGAEATHGALPDSVSALEPPTITPAGSQTPDGELMPLLLQQIPNVRLLADTLRTADLDGPRDLRGRRVYILTRAAPEGRTLYVVVDAETFDVREIEQSVTRDSLAKPLVTRLVYDDFRTADGLTVPYRVRLINEGLDQFIPETERMVRGGQASVARGQIDLLPPGAERDARRVQLDRDLRLYTEGVQEYDLRIERVTRVGG